MFLAYWHQGLTQNLGRVCKNKSRIITGRMGAWKLFQMKVNAIVLFMLSP